MLIFDCSNSAKSELNKQKLYGPKENDILRYLKQYASEFGHEFVTNYNDADIILTNDIFPESFVGKKKIKRMDGVFARADTVHRNGPLNAAAQKADHVIFVSEFSKDSYFNLYDPNHNKIKNYSVIPNEVDPSIFYPKTNYDQGLNKLIAVASDWGRVEKRLGDLILFAQQTDINIVLVGNVHNVHLPSNIFVKGYIDDPVKLADSLRDSDAMISLSYKDPYPKTMVQAKYCGLPILYANSGGQSQMDVSGVAINDIKDISIDYNVPHLNINDIKNSWNIFNLYFAWLKEIAMKFDGKEAFALMLKKYFAAMESVL